MGLWDYGTNLFRVMIAGQPVTALKGQPESAYAGNPARPVKIQLQHQSAIPPPQASRLCRGYTSGLAQQSPGCLYHFSRLRNHLKADQGGGCYSMPALILYCTLSLHQAPSSPVESITTATPSPIWIRAVLSVLSTPSGWHRHGYRPAGTGYCV